MSNTCCSIGNNPIGCDAAQGAKVSVASVTLASLFARANTALVGNFFLFKYKPNPFFFYFNLVAKTDLFTVSFDKQTFSVKSYHLFQKTNPLVNAINNCRRSLRLACTKLVRFKGQKNTFLL